MKPLSSSSASSQQSLVAAATGGGGRKKHQPKLYVEWDTNFDGQWEMEESNPIKDFLNAQRHPLMEDGVEAGSLIATGQQDYDNVFKMNRSEVNEEQTMLIKSFLTKKATTTATEDDRDEEQHKNSFSSESNQQPQSQPIVGSFGFGDENEEFLPLSPHEMEGRRRLFERETRGGDAEQGSWVNSYLPEREPEEPTATEFDANLNAFKAKFTNTNIRNLWSDELKSEDACVSMQHQPPPMNVNSFWQNYNKHLYEIQDPGHGQVSLNSLENVFNAPAAAAAPWPMDSDWQSNNNTNAKTTQMTIWSNEEQNDFGSDLQQDFLQQYNEHMAAAYKKQLAYGGTTGSVVSSSESNGDLLSGTWSTEESSLLGGNTTAGAAMGSDFDQLYFGGGGGVGFPEYSCNWPLGQEAQYVDMAVDGNNNNTVSGEEEPEVMEMVVNLKLEQSIAMLNHSSTSSFAKVDRKALMISGGGFRGQMSTATDVMRNRGVDAGIQQQQSDRMRNAAAAASGASTITNMTSLYGSFAQNPAENLLNSEKTHFRPIKQVSEILL